MTLQDRVWPRFLRGPDQTLVEQLYEPALSAARRYDRSCAYFSSSVLAAAARGFGPLIESLLALGNDAPKPAIRLLVNEELSLEDVEAALTPQSDSELADRLLKRLGEPLQVLETDRLAMLGFLVKHGLLEIQVGVMRHGRGILHAKFGIVTDSAGNAIVFNGSGNESATGLTANYEKLEISTSWGDPERYAHFREEFDQLWQDQDPAVAVVPLPEAVRLKLVRFVKHESWRPRETDAKQRSRERHIAAMRWRFALEAPFMAGGATSTDAMALVSPWPHQIRVVEETAGAWPAGRLLCDEVGMGKTIEAILVLRRLLAGRGASRVLWLVPAGLLKQWQDELREKGGLIVPRLEGHRTLVWPDETVATVDGLAQALEAPLMLVSREFARLEQNATAFLHAPKWDVILLDEAHAARRAKQEEREFNSATLLLDLLRQVQLHGRTRGLMLLSATPMQTHPWEPWDLLSVLGEGSPWLRGDFAVVREFYDAAARLTHAGLSPQRAKAISRIIEVDGAFPPQSPPALPITVRLTAGTAAQRELTARWLRRCAPLGRRMHRNTRATLRRYFQQGLISRPPPTRVVQSALFEFEDVRERDLYDAITRYVNRRFQELESERPGKGFVMTVYRRRASSSLYALHCSLTRRASGLRRVVAAQAVDAGLDLDPEDARDFDELGVGDAHGPLSSALPEDAKTAGEELRDVQHLLGRLTGLGAVDSKFDRFLEVLKLIANDGRPVLVFSEFTDTVRYLRNQLFPKYGAALACYTGSGGEEWREEHWVGTSKERITERLRAGDIRVLLCSDAASEGLNLQAAAALINYDMPWNPSRVEQRIGRIDRIGQLADTVRVANLMLRDSVDERVYQVLDERCQLFEHFVGAMQPVLAEARPMLLGVRPFDEDVLVAAEERVKAEAAALAAFEESAGDPPTGTTPAATLQDLERALDGVCPGRTVEIRGEQRALVASSLELAKNRLTWPLSPLCPHVRGLGRDLVEAGELLPLVIGTIQQGSFRSSHAVWIGAQAPEPVRTMAELESLMEQWDGGLPAPKAWVHAETQASEAARVAVDAMQVRALEQERAGLRRQIEAATLRLTREVGRFLLCLEPAAVDLNQTFHSQQLREIAASDRLRRVHALIGYPAWRAELVQELRAEVSGLAANQRKSILIGSPLDAALDDPRWVAVKTLAGLEAN